MMRATEFEFRYRAAIFGVIFGSTLSMLWVDHVPVGVRMGSWLARQTGMYESMATHIVFWIGTLLLVLGGLMRTWGASYLGMETVHDKAVHTEALHADGPYRYLRNPLYFGNVLMALGMGFIAPAYVYPVLVLLIVVFNYRLIGREEAELESTQGERYLAYKRAVPRLFPALTPRLPDGTDKADWAVGFATEAWFWSFTAGVAGFAATFNMLWFFGGMVASPFAGMAADKMLKRSRAAAA